MLGPFFDAFISGFMVGVGVALGASGYPYMWGVAGFGLLGMTAMTVILFRSRSRR